MTPRPIYLDHHATTPVDPRVFEAMRPFFLENANYFSTPITTLLYTRNIVHPEYGLRLTGKTHGTNLGFLAIDDRNPGETVAPGEIKGLRAEARALLCAMMADDLA